MVPASARVGALFLHDASGNHFCTASVVASAGRDLLVTAAHCINGGPHGGARSDTVFIPGYRNLVRVTGYQASKDRPITGRNWTTRKSGTQLRFDCDGFTGGTSGSPWITGFNATTGTGRIVGVLGGFQPGGTTAGISYSADRQRHQGQAVPACGRLTACTGVSGRLRARPA
jgi:V8-like Glu-specific endopeptidase